MTTLDRIAEENAIKDVKLIKIDVEGFELDVLKGAEKVVSQWNPVFVMEFNSYAIAANRLISPMEVLQYVVTRFGKFTTSRGEVSETVSTDKEVRDFFYSNMVTQGCVEDIYFGGTFHL